MCPHPSRGGGVMLRLTPTYQGSRLTCKGVWLQAAVARAVLQWWWNPPPSVGGLEDCRYNAGIAMSGLKESFVNICGGNEIVALEHTFLLTKSNTKQDKQLVWQSRKSDKVRGQNWTPWDCSSGVYRPRAAG